MARVVSTLAFLTCLALASTAASRTSIAQQAPASGSEASKSEGKAAAKPQSNRQAKKDAPKAEGEAAAGGPRDPAAIDKTLQAAQKSLDTNKPDQAVGQINSLIATGGLDARSMARALALRGHAYKKQGKPAQAISDLQSALYLRNGLNETERAAALQARTEAYREAGLGEAPPVGGSAKTQPVKSTSVSSTPAAAPPPAAASNIATATVSAKPEAPAASGGGVGGFFSNLFGASKQAAPAAEPAPRPKAPADPAISSWTSAEEKPGKAVKQASAATATASAATAATKPAAAEAKTAAAPAPASEVRYMRLAASRTEAEAKALADRVRKEHGSQFGQRDYQVAQEVIGNMGTFYRVRIGPYSDAREATGHCSTLRNKGVDCHVSER